MSEPEQLIVDVSGTVDSIAITEIRYKLTIGVGGQVFKEETFVNKVNIPLKSASL